LGDYPDHPVIKKHKDVLKEYESKVQSCSRGIEIVNGYEAHGVAKRELVSAIADFRSLISMPASNKLAEVFAGVSSELRDAHSKAKDIVEAAERDGLAKYTVETEADELGLEQFVQLGFKTSDWIDADFVFNSDPEADGEEKAAYDQCLAAYKRGWKTESGSAYLPKRGGFYDPHPRPCFRSVDMAREADAHHYETLAARQPPKALEGSEWTQINERAKSIAPVEEERKHSGRVRFVHPWKNPLYGCYYRRSRSYEGKE
jgi:hypothetical protein